MPNLAGWLRSYCLVPPETFVTSELVKSLLDESRWETHLLFCDTLPCLNGGTCISTRERYRVSSGHELSAARELRL